MGYTHYWNRKKADIPLSLWQRAIEQIRPIIESNRKILSDIEMSDDRIFFNGQHETFVVQRCYEPPYSAAEKFPDHFSFCKTAAKEYDPVVVACLLIFDYVLADDPVGFRWSSDGDWPQEHNMGIELCGVPFENLRGPSE